MQLIRRVQPAARQRFTGGKGQIRFGKPFRFLQLFCENGNIEMKRFLLSQTNDAEGTQKKTNSIKTNPKRFGAEIGCPDFKKKY
jgi:hypothetical protein